MPASIASIRRVTMALTCALFVGSCGGSGPIQENVTGVATSNVYVVSHGWHAGLVIHRDDIPKDKWPEKRDFFDAEYLEIGFGDRDYYMEHDPGPFTAIKAALWPTPSVLHVVGFRGPVQAYFPMSDIRTLPVSRSGLDRLVAFIDASHDRRDQKPLTSIGHGLYGNSRYYPGRESFHLFNNCNIWTARALRAAGYDVRGTITVGGLLQQLEE